MSIKIIHTSDWHLGKKLFNESRLPEQKLFTDWLLREIKEQEIDALLISGDIFDTPSPPTQAQKIYFDFLNEATKNTSLHIYIIGGNHDSGLFLEAPTPFLKEKNIHISGRLMDNDIFQSSSFSHVLKKGNEEVNISLLPYFRNHEIYNLLQTNQIDIKKNEDEHENFLLILERLIDSIVPQKKCPNILLAHHLIGSYDASGSEQALFLSGLESIPTKIFRNKVDYLALGHIHKSQIVSKENPIAVYPGSPIPFRFSESNKKKVSLITIEDGVLSYILQEVPPFRKLFSLKVRQSQLEEKIKEELGHLEKSKLISFLECTIEIESPEASLTDRIKKSIKSFPVQLISSHQVYKEQEKESKATFNDIKSLSPKELFELFYKKKYPESPIVPENISKSFEVLLSETFSENHENPSS